MIRTEISERRLAFGGTSQLARFFLSRVLASIMASLDSAALVVPSLEGLLARVMRVLGTPVSHGARPGVPFRFQAGCLFRPAHYPAPLSQCVSTPHGETHFMMTCGTIIDADMRVISFGQRAFVQVHFLSATTRGHRASGRQ